MNTRPFYHYKDIWRVLRVPFSRIDYWVRAGVLELDYAEHFKTVRRRFYSFRDIVAIYVLKQFRDQGTHLEVAANIARYIHKYFDEYMKMHEDDDFVVVYADGKGERFGDNLTGVKKMEMKSIWFLIPLSRFIDNLRGALEGGDANG